MRYGYTDSWSSSPSGRSRAAWGARSPGFILRKIGYQLQEPSMLAGGGSALDNGP